MIWLVGGKGMLGEACARLIESQKILHVNTDREVDIADYDRLKSFAEGAFRQPPGWIINCAAYTAVDQAENEEDLAMRINGQGPACLARLAAGSGSRLIHISTDYVFDGQKDSPYAEDDPVGPLGAYGRTKLAGETAVRSGCASHFIIRPAWLYGHYGRNFVATVIRLLNEKDEVRIVDDQWGSPTNAADLAGFILWIIQNDSRRYGTWHYTNEGYITWYEFAIKIQEMGLKYGLVKKDTPVKPVTTSQYPTLARRPAFSVLSKKKVREELGVPVRYWDEALNDHLAGEVNT
jgi:dTDP-4-dehydrorhamnose reductase